ncbi:MAG: AbrB/MazE/SpoVT family DNA-binding domain-containing protein [Thermosphaera aggregans]|jgi:AbrB family looped-hinge helix DNA binding protein
MDGRYNRTTIPREVRKLLGISEGDVVKRVYEDGKVIVKRSV